MMSVQLAPPFVEMNTWSPQPLPCAMYWLMVDATSRCGLAGSTLMPLNDAVMPDGVTLVQAPFEIVYFQICPLFMGSDPELSGCGPAPLAYVMYTLPAPSNAARCGIRPDGLPDTAVNDAPALSLR